MLLLGPAGGRVMLRKNRSNWRPAGEGPRSIVQKWEIESCDVPGGYEDDQEHGPCFSFAAEPRAQMNAPIAITRMSSALQMRNNDPYGLRERFVGR